MATLRDVVADTGEEESVGIRVNLKPQLVALNLNLTGSVHLSDLGELSPSSFDGSSGAGMTGPVQDEQIGLDLTLDSGQSALIECLTDGAEGSRLISLVTATLIDPVGQPIDR